MADKDPYPVPVEVRLVMAPNSKPAVALQLPDGYVLFPSPESARQVATMLTDSADELEKVLGLYA